MNAKSAILSRQTFLSDDKCIRLFGDFVVAAVVRDRVVAPRILEIGCGDGSLLMHLLERIDGSRGTGVDLSPTNITAARRLAAIASAPAEFIVGDYLTIPLPQYDLVVSHNTLHILPGGKQKLFPKIAGEVAPGGLLVFSMAYDCTSTRLLTLVRRGLRLVRCPPVERGLFWISKLAHGRRYSDTALRDRLIYNFLTPERYYSPALAAMLHEMWGLESVAEKLEPTLLGKLALKYVQLRKRKPAA